MGNCWGGPGQADQILVPEDAEGFQVSVGQSQPLLHEQVVWSSDVPLTDGQLRGKRDTFWETAPAYDGRREIWDALRAAAEAAELEDYDLAQAILDGAGVSLPTGRLTEAYDELGSRYVIPKYCLSKPTNFQGTLTTNTSQQGQEATERQKPRSSGTPMTVKVRLSTADKDLRIGMTTSARVRDLKQKLQRDHGVVRSITMLYSGRVLKDSVAIRDLKIPKGYVIQAVVS